MEHNSSHFEFDGSTASAVRTTAAAALITIVSLGVAFPAGLVLHQRWRARHSIVNGRRLRFTGSARELFADWWPAYLLTLCTLGLYGFAVYPRVLQWTWEHTTFGDWQSVHGPSTHPALLSPPSRLHLAFINEPGRHQLAG